MVRVHAWSATRSGATMTVTGKSPGTDAPIRLTGVERIGVQEGEIVAIRGASVIGQLIA